MAVNPLQVLEYDTPEKLLENRTSAFSKMVQSTGSANAEYLRSLVVRKNMEGGLQIDEQMRRLLSSRWNSATRFALALSFTSSIEDLQLFELEDNNSVLNKTKDAAVILHEVLVGKYDKVIEETLDQLEVPKYRWWSAFHRVVEGVF